MSVQERHTSLVVRHINLQYITVSTKDLLQMPFIHIACQILNNNLFNHQHFPPNVTSLPR
jgi:hypothetical protein